MCHCVTHQEEDVGYAHIPVLADICEPLQGHKETVCAVWDFYQCLCLDLRASDYVAGAVSAR